MDGRLLAPKGMNRECFPGPKGGYWKARISDTPYPQGAHTRSQFEEGSLLSCP